MNLSIRKVVPPDPQRCAGLSIDSHAARNIGVVRAQTALENRLYMLSKQPKAGLVEIRVSMGPPRIGMPFRDDLPLVRAIFVAKTREFGHRVLIVKHRIR